MNPIEILEILAIAVHSFSEMPGLGQTLLRTVQMSAGLGAGAHAARQRPHSEDQSNIDKTEEKSEKITRAGHCIMARPQLSSSGLCWQIGPVFMLY